jgi:hypothetical protein
VCLYIALFECFFGFHSRLRQLGSTHGRPKGRPVGRPFGFFGGLRDMRSPPDVFGGIPTVAVELVSPILKLALAREVDQTGGIEWPTQCLLVSIHFHFLGCFRPVRPHCCTKWVDGF